MSGDAPRAPDRPRLAEALASLKEGLRDTADPFFDGWKRPRAAAEVEANVSAVARSVAEAEAPACAGPPVADLASLPTEVSLQALDTEISEAPPFDAHLEAEAQIPPRDELDAPTIEMAKVQIGGPPVGLVVESPRSPPLPPTVRVHVIRYPVFPRWALVAAAALLVFAASVIGLRLAYPTTAPSAVLVASAPPTEATSPTASTASETEPTSPTPSTASETEAAPGTSSADPAATAAGAGVTTSSSRAGPQPPPRDRRVKVREGKPHASGFFREPGF